MKLIIHYSESHRQLLDLSVRSARDTGCRDEDIVPVELDQLCPGGGYATPGFGATMLARAADRAEKLRRYAGETVFFADADIVYLDERWMQPQAETGELLFQDNGNVIGNLGRERCCGFVVQLADRQAINFWSEVEAELQALVAEGGNREQRMVNAQILPRYRSRLLSRHYANPKLEKQHGLSATDLWMFHANWIRGKDHKMARLTGLMEELGQLSAATKNPSTSTPS